MRPSTSSKWRDLKKFRMSGSLEVEGLSGQGGVHQPWPQAYAGDFQHRRPKGVSWCHAVRTRTPPPIPGGRCQNRNEPRVAISGFRSASLSLFLSAERDGVYRLFWNAPREQASLTLKGADQRCLICLKNKDQFGFSINLAGQACADRCLTSIQSIHP